MPIIEWQEQFFAKKIKQMVLSTTVKPNWMRTSDNSGILIKLRKKQIITLSIYQIKQKKLIFDNDNINFNALIY